jgi:hypothetical protein
MSVSSAPFLKISLRPPIFSQAFLVNLKQYPDGTKTSFGVLDKLKPS